MYNRRSQYLHAEEQNLKLGEREKLKSMMRHNRLPLPYEFVKLDYLQETENQSEAGLDSRAWTGASYAYQRPFNALLSNDYSDEDDNEGHTQKCSAANSYEYDGLTQDEVTLKDSNTKLQGTTNKINVKSQKRMTFWDQLAELAGIYDYW